MLASKRCQLHSPIGVTCSILTSQRPRGATSARGRKILVTKYAVAIAYGIFTMARHSERDEHPFEDGRGYGGNRRRRKWPWVLLALLAVGLFLLPNLIAMTGLKQRAIDFALADFNGRCTVDSATLGWLQPIELTNVQAVGSQGQPLLRVERIKTSGNLISFLTSSDYGQVDIERPAVWLHLREGGSNLEDACAAWLSENQANEPDAATNMEVTLPKMQLNVIDGVVAMTVEGNQHTWQLENLNVHANTTDQTAAAVANLAAQVTQHLPAADNGRTLQGQGSLNVAVQVDPGSRQLTSNAVNAIIDSNSVPLSVLGPALTRVVGTTTTDGVLSADLQATYNSAAQEVQLFVKSAEAQNAMIYSPQMLGSDRVQIASLQSTGNLALGPTRVHADQFQIASDFANASVNGTLDIDQLSQLATSSSMTDGGLLNTPFQMNGQLDLAGLAAVMPATLQLNEGLKIQSGVVNFQAGSRIQNDQRRLIVNLDTANLVAVDQGKPIVWQKPLRLVGSIRESGQTLVLEELRCESDFLTIAGNATAEAGSFVAKGDLDRMVERVGQFVDLSDMQLSGEIDGKLAWQTAAHENAATASVQNRPIQLVGEFQVDHPAFQMPGLQRWSRPNLTARVSAAGQSTIDQRMQVDQAGLQIDIGTEQAIFTLAQPIADAYVNNRWQVNSQLSGAVAGWLAHVQNFADLGDIRANGQLQAQAMTVIDANAIEVLDAKYDVQQLQFDGYGVTVREEQTSGTGSARYDFQTGQLILADQMLSSNSVSLGGQRIVIETADVMQINGDVAFRVDVNKVADWLALSPTDDSVFWFGNGEGTVQFQSDSQGISARVQTSVQDMVAATRQPTEARLGSPETASPMRTVSSAAAWSPLWREAKVNVSGDVTMSNDFNAIRFQNTSIESAALNVQASGQITDLANSMVTDINGQWTPDWEKLNALLAAYSGDLVQIAGQGSHPISFRGPLFAAPQLGRPTALVSSLLQASSRFDWQQAAVAGMPIDAGSMQLSVDQGIATVNTSDIRLGGGVVRLQPQVDLRSEEPVLYLPQGKLIDNVALTPAIARQWLKLVAPLAADATSAEGQFTLAVEGAKVPLYDLMKANAQGTLTLSNVVIGAGPTAQQLIATAKQLRGLLDPQATSDRDLNTWLRVEEQAVPVSVQDGRVFHDGMRISHKDIVVRTRGSVGLDQSLDLVAEIPIADDWIEGKKHFASLRGQTISIPVRGTASRPQVDTRAMQQVSAQLVRQAAGGAINDAFQEKVAPKLNEYQQQLTGKVNEKVGELQNKLQDKLQKQAGELFKQQAKEQAKGELLKGLGNLFGK